MLPQIIKIPHTAKNSMKGRSNQGNYCNNLFPFNQQPSVQFQSFFYKTMDRIDDHRLVIRIGLKLHQIRRFEEDHLLFLLQIFNRECPRILVYLIYPNILYGQVKIDVFQKDSEDAEVIELERDLFQLLKASSLFFANYIKETLSQQRMVSQMSKNGKFQERFEDEVIKKVKEQEIRILSGISQRK